jgi:hypothetical protein
MATQDLIPMLAVAVRQQLMVRHHSLPMSNNHIRVTPPLLQLVLDHMGHTITSLLVSSPDMLNQGNIPIHHQNHQKAVEEHQGIIRRQHKVDVLITSSHHSKIQGDNHQEDTGQTLGIHMAAVGTMVTIKAANS